MEREKRGSRVKPILIDGSDPLWVRGVRGFLVPYGDGYRVVWARHAINPDKVRRYLNEHKGDRILIDDAGDLYRRLEALMEREARRK